MKEAVTGFIIGFGANLCSSIVSLPGILLIWKSGYLWLRLWIRLQGNHRVFQVFLPIYGYADADYQRDA